MKKDFDKESKKQFKDIHSLYHQQQNDIDELSDLIKDNTEVIDTLSKAPPWSQFYELPYRSFLAICILEFELAEVVHEIATANDQIQSFIDCMDEMAKKLEVNETLSEEEKSLRFSLVMAITNQFSSISIHGLSLSELVQKVRDNNDKALFDAVLVDRSIVSAPSIAYRIQKAQLSGEESFMDGLSKAIKKSRPCRRRPEKIYDDLRYMLVVLEEQIGLENIKNKDLLKLMEEDLQLYPKGSDTGSLRAFEQFVQRLNEKYRT